jgi:hypothetical protein
MTYVLLQEILRSSDIPYDDDSLKMVMANQLDLVDYKLEKKLGSLGEFTFSLYKCTRNKTKMGVIKKKNKVIGSVYLTKLLDSKEFSRSFETNSLQILESYRGQNLSYFLYKKLIIEADLILVSGKMQSPGGESVWKKISRDKNITVERIDLLSKAKITTPVRSHNAQYHTETNKDKRYVAFKK